MKFNENWHKIKMHWEYFGLLYILGAGGLLVVGGLGWACWTLLFNTWKQIGG